MSSKKKKNLDRVSLLPDFVLHSILSLLDIRQVVQTCVLSKRWKTLWIDIPTLNFDLDSYPFEGSVSTRNSKQNSFMRFVLRVLSGCCSTDIQKLSYSNTKPDDVITNSVFQLLICYAQTHKLQQLCFNTHDHVYYKWPCCLSECSHLTELKIKCGFVDNWATLKSPSLRILEIECQWEYRFQGQEYLDVEMFSGCPKLKSLVLINFQLQRAKICATNLENLELCCSSPSFPQIELLSSRLVNVKFSNVLPTLNLASANRRMKEVYIELEIEHLNNQRWTTTFIRLLRVFRNATSFVLPLKAIEVLMSINGSLSGILFCNLRYLKLKTKETKTMVVIDLPITTLAFLHKCPLLKTLAIGSN